MKKRFKEYRMFIVLGIVTLIFLVSILYNVIVGRYIRIIAFLILMVMSLGLMLGRYNIMLYDDYMVIYEWKLAAMLPTLIDYQDIRSIKKKSKHHIVIKHKKKSHIYVFDSDKFLKYYKKIQK